jgi:hypothetical protein
MPSWMSHKKKVLTAYGIDFIEDSSIAGGLIIDGKYWWFEGKWGVIGKEKIYTTSPFKKWIWWYVPNGRSKIIMYEKKHKSGLFTSCDVDEDGHIISV